MASHLRETKDLTSTLEGETLRLRGEIEDERKKIAAAKAEADTAIWRCDRAVLRYEDHKATNEVREEGLSKVISELEAKVKCFVENKQKLTFTISELRKGKGVDWE